MAIFVNGEEISEIAIQQEVQRMKPHYSKLESDMTEEQGQFQLYEWACENLIEQVLFRQIATADKSPIEPARVDEIFQEMCSQSDSKDHFLERAGKTETDLREQIIDGLKISRLHSQIIDNSTKPQESDLKEFYDQNPEQFIQPELVHASHIVLHPGPGSTDEKIKQKIFDLYQQLQDGTSFATIASQYSSCPDSAGDLGWFPRGHMVQAFEDVVFNLEPGTISEPFKTEFGWHIAKVIQRSAEQTIPFDQIKKQIAEQLDEEYQQQALDDFIDAEKLKAEIKR